MFELLAHDNHPPLYFILLKPWAALFGPGDLALRGFSLLCSVATVAVVFALGNLFSKKVGLAAGALAALSPPLVIYAQEARMYSLVTLLVALATYSLAKLMEVHSARWVWGYSLSMAAALHTHHFAWLAFGAHVLFVLSLRRKDKMPLQAACLVLAFYLPALPLTIRQIQVARGMTWRPRPGLWYVPKDIWLFLNLGTGQARLLTTWGAALLIVAGFTLGWKSGIRHWSLIALTISMPIATIFIVQQVQSIYTDRYLLYLAPFFCLLVALGAWEVAKALSQKRVIVLLTTLLVPIVIPMYIALSVYYAGRGPLKSDWKAVAAHIEDTARKGDALALIQSAPPFLHYYKGNLPWQAFPEISVEDYVSSEEKVATQLKKIAQPGSVIWWIGSGWEIADPQNLVEAQLREHGTYWDERWWHKPPFQSPIRVAAYVIEDTDFGPEPREFISANFGDQLELTGYHIQFERDALYVALWWKVLHEPEKSYNAFVHLIDGEGNIISQGDRVPLNSFYPIQRWQPGQLWRDEHRVELPQGTDTASHALNLRVGLSWGERGENQLEIKGTGWSFLILPIQPEKHAP